MNIPPSAPAVDQPARTSAGSARIESLLSIFIITYNRQGPLKDSLTALRASSWARCNVTILDNCSTDDTQAVVQALAPTFANLTYVCNVTNIGLAANAIQPFLMSQTPYTWILCDDDNLDFTCLDDIEAALFAQQATLLLVGGHDDPGRTGAGQTAAPHALMDAGVNYYRDSSFLPSTIYATAFARRHLTACYSACHFNYPHMALTLAAAQAALPVYVSKHRLVTPTIGTQSYSRREQLHWWFGLACTVPDIRERKRLLTSQWQGPLDPSGLYGLLNTAVRLKHHRIALCVVAIFKGKVLQSVVTMLRARMRGVRYSQ